MAETDEAGIGFDRRSLIKKGLVAGGVVATAPVISTFNVPAFAASPGVFRIAMNIATAAGIITVNTRVSPTPSGGCTEIAPDFVGTSPDPGPGAIGISPSIGPNTLTTRVLTFTLTGEAAAECVFTAARRRAANGVDCTADTPPVPASDVSFIVNVNHLSEYHFVVTCS